MLCKIADLIVEVPDAGGMAPRCRVYLYDGAQAPDIILTPEQYSPKRWPALSWEGLCYMESGVNFYGKLLRFHGMMLHASAVAFDGRAYLFSAPSGTGKSTHTKLWQAVFGDAAQVFNDDKPALRHLDGVWYAYGTPWSGKDGINQNKKLLLGGICYLKRGTENKIRRLTPQEAMKRIVSQTMRRFALVENLDLMLGHVDLLVRNIPVYELECLPNEDAARLSCEIMRSGAEEMGL